jgi:hypothetical protein
MDMIARLDHKPGQHRTRMSKFQCTCGHIISDNGQFDHIKGLILREQSSDVAYEAPSDTIADFIQAIAAGKRREWIENFYGRPGFDLEDSSVVFDIMLYARQRSALDIYQCEACGRIYIEREPQQSSGALRRFKPEDPDWQGTLAVKIPSDSNSATTV